MSVLIHDTDTLNLLFDEDGHNLTSPPATEALVTMDFHESLLSGTPTVSSAYVTMNFHESLLNGNPTCRVTMQFWETLVSVNHSTFHNPDTLNLQFIETIKKLIQDVDTLNLSISDGQPAYVSDIHPTTIPIEQPFVMLYVIGFGFTEGAQIVFNGQPQTTTYVSPMELTAKIPPTAITPLGTLEVYVTE
jgi:hypothetical protein